MLSVYAKEQVIYLSFVKGTVFGSVLVSGGKDLEGNSKPNGFMKVNFSNAVVDKIYELEDLSEDSKAIICDLKGFIAYNEYNDVKELKLIVTDISNLKIYVKEEKKPVKPVRKAR